MKLSYGFTNSYRTFVVPINFILQLNLVAFAVYCCFFCCYCWGVPWKGLPLYNPSIVYQNKPNI